MNTIYSQCPICHQNITLGHAMWCELYVGPDLIIDEKIFQDSTELDKEIHRKLIELVEKQQGNSSE